MFEDAIKELKQVIRIDKKDSDAYNNLGVAYANTAEYKKAASQFRKALWLNPLRIDAKRNLRMVKMAIDKQGVGKK